MRDLRLVVDHDRPWLEPGFDERAIAKLRAVEPYYRPRVLAWRARREASEERRPWRGAASVEVGRDPRARVETSIEAEPRGVSPRPQAACPSVPPSPSSWQAPCLLAIPYVVGALGALAGYFLAYLFGAVR